MHRYFIACFLLCSSALFSTPKMIVGIAGGTGSGKTTLAEKLSSAFKDHTVLIYQDSYYKDLTHLSKQERAQHNFDHPDAIDFELLKTHLIALKENRAIEMPVYNFCNHAREPFKKKIESADIIIVEGILIFAVPEVRDLFDLKIFVETDDDIRLLRRIERDMSDRDRDFSSIRDQYTATVKPMHDAFVEPSKRFADVIVPTSHRNENGIGMIIASLKMNLDYIAEAEKNQALSTLKKT